MYIYIFFFKYIHMCIHNKYAYHTHIYIICKHKHLFIINRSAALSQTYRNTSYSTVSYMLHWIRTYLYFIFCY